MAMHARRQILEKVKDLLTFPDIRIAPVTNVTRQPETAAVFIDWSDETVESVHIMGNPLRQRRNSNIRIALLRQTTENDVDLTADADAEQLERELSNPTLAGLVTSWRLAAVTKDIDSTGERPVARLNYTYEAIYHTQADAPGTIA